MEEPDQHAVEASVSKSLLGCPFCGGDAERLPYGNDLTGIAVGCPHCDFFFFNDEAGRQGITPEQLWNRRAAERPN